MESTKPLVSVVIITLVRESLYKLVERLTKEKTDFEYEIVVIPHKPFDADLFKIEKVKIFPQEDGKGLAFYRNQGVQNAQGEIISFIDDDEYPKNNQWLQNLVSPIIKNETQITTAGTDIPLKQGYLADSISLLGYPGGAALGFKTLWKVDENNLTNHLCSGNFAVKKSFFLELGGFETTLKHGKEDIYLAQVLKEKDEKILYVEEATIDHLPRDNFWGFVRWHFARGRAIAEYSRLKLLSTNHILYLFRVFGKTLKRAWLTPYLPLVILLWPIQYLSQTFGLLYGRIKD